jgi:hypothetical protein
MPDDLTALWRARWPSTPPIASRLRGAYPDLWVRFHSLPDSKRYPEDEGEYAVVLDRYNAVLDELFAGKDVYIVTPTWSEDSAEPSLQPDGTFWLSVSREETDMSKLHLFIVRRPWERGCADSLLRDVADWKITEVFITDAGMQRIHHPYDGGADVFLATPAERDSLRRRHRDWLSIHPSGL